MVLTGEEESMAMATEKSKPLHNFMLPSLKWGNQRQLRCMKLPTETGNHQPPPPAPPVTQNRELEASLNNAARGSDKKQKRIITTKPPIHGDDGIDAVREKLMFDLKTETDRIKDVILGKEVKEEENGDDDDDEEIVAAAMMAVVKSGTGAGEGSSAAPVGERPWNLRTRNKGIAIGESGKGLLKIDDKKPEKTERAKFSVSLSKKEIEEDFLQLLGHKPPRRPKKRPRNVQKQLDASFPGLWLSEITPESYKVPDENGGNKKKKWG